MRVVQTFKCRQQSADDGLHIFGQGNMTHSLLFPFSRACLRVVLAGGILVLHPATEHCGQCCDRIRYACIPIQGRMQVQANSDTEISHACVSYMHEDDFSFTFTSMNVVFKGS